MDPTGCQDPLTMSKSCGRELSTQVAIIFAMADFGNRMMDSVVLPRYRHWFREKFNGLDEGSMCQAELQYAVLER